MTVTIFVFSNSEMELMDSDYSTTVSSLNQPTNSVELNRRGMGPTLPSFVFVLATGLLLLLVSVTSITMVAVVVNKRCKNKQPIQTPEAPNRGPALTMETHQYCY